MLLEFGSDMGELVENDTYHCAQNFTNRSGVLPIRNQLPSNRRVLRWKTYIETSVRDAQMSLSVSNMAHNDTILPDSPLPSTVDNITADCPQ